MSEQLSVVAKPCYATTLDNMYNPFTEYDKWKAFDIEHKYYTNELLAIFSKHSINMEEDEFDACINDAVNMLLFMNPFGIHYKVYEEDADIVIPLANEAFKKYGFSNGNKPAVTSKP